MCGVHRGKWEARRVDASSPTPSASALSPHHGEHLRGGGVPSRQLLPLPAQCSLCLDPCRTPFPSRVLLGCPGFTQQPREHRAGIPVTPRGPWHVPWAVHTRSVPCLLFPPLDAPFLPPPAGASAPPHNLPSWWAPIPWFMYHVWTRAPIPPLSRAPDSAYLGFLTPCFM